VEAWFAGARPERAAGDLVNGETVNGETAGGAAEGPAAWRITVDPELCMGTGVCAGTAPTYFDLEAGTSRPRIELTPPDQELLDVARSCPMEAIMVVETATGAVLVPED
jgi:ferredoxin